MTRPAYAVTKWITPVYNTQSLVKGISGWFKLFAYMNCTFNQVVEKVSKIAEASVSEDNNCDDVYANYENREETTNTEVNNRPAVW